MLPPIHFAVIDARQVGCLCGSWTEGSPITTSSRAVTCVVCVALLGARRLTALPGHRYRTRTVALAASIAAAVRVASMN